MQGPSMTGVVLGGRYELGELLGQGGYGSVYAATQLDLGRSVAIKVLHVDVALSPDGLARFEREAKAAAALGHPNLAQVTDFQMNPGEPPFLVMERLSGQTMGAALGTNGRMAPARVMNIASQVLAALDAAHRCGIVHRDVKPDNIFLVSATGVEDLVKLLDFGIAKLTAEPHEKLTASGSMLGSPAYMAPEQIRSLTFDHRVDLYAVGATMYRAISGRFPFEATSVHGLLLAITEQRAVPLCVLDPAVDTRLSALVERAMHKDPMGRFESAAAMREEVERIAMRRPSLVAPTPAMIPDTRPLMPPIAYPAHSASAPPPTPRSAPSYAAPHAYSAPPPPAYYGPPASASQSRPTTGSGGGGAVIAIVIVVALLLLAGGAFAAFHFLRAPQAREEEKEPITSAAPKAAAPSTTAAPSAASTTTAAQTAGGGAIPRPRVADAGAPPLVIAVDAGAPAPLVIAVDAGSAPRKQMAGSVATVSGGVFDVYDVSKGREAVGRAMPAINACFAASEFDPPDHQFTVWVLSVDPAGNVKSAAPKTEASNHPKLAPCVVRALMSTKWEPKPTGGHPEIHLGARTRDNP